MLKLVNEGACEINNGNQYLEFNYLTQIAHDIKSPIAALKSVLNNSTSEQTQSEAIAKTALNRILKLAEKILDGNLLKEESTLDLQICPLNKLIEDISFEKNYEYEKYPVVVNFKSLENDLLVSCDRSVLSRVLSNLVNNSVEAINHSGNVEIKLEKMNNTAVIQVTDKGCGIPFDKLRSVIKRGISYKESGNGLGLSYASEMIFKFNGDFKVISEQGKGTTILITLPLVKDGGFESLNQEMVLIDDDELVRMNWEYHAKCNSMTLRTFSSFSEFLKNRENISDCSSIYIDSELGAGVRGENLAPSLYKMGFTELILTTGYERALKNNSYFKSVVGKSFPERNLAG